jgi:hypothetical protein
VPNGSKKGPKAASVLAMGGYENENSVAVEHAGESLNTQIGSSTW